MAFVNGTVKIRMEFVTAGGSHADATNIKLNVYDVNSTLIETVGIDETSRVAVGTYEVDYVIPAGYTEVVAQVVGQVGNATIVGAVEIETGGVDTISGDSFLNEVKKTLMITDTSKDEYLLTTIPYLVDFIQNYCNRDFKNAAGQVELPLGLKLALAQMAQHCLKDYSSTSLKMGNASFEYPDNFPRSILTILDKYKNRSVKFY